MRCPLGGDLLDAARAGALVISGMCGLASGTPATTPAHSVSGSGEAVSAPGPTAARGVDVRWWTIDGGGGRVRGGGFVLDGSVGQPDAGHASGGDFHLAGGFWAAPDPAPRTADVFRDGFEPTDVSTR